MSGMLFRMHLRKQVCFASLFTSIQIFKGNGNIRRVLVDLSLSSQSSLAASLQILI